MRTLLQLSMEVEKGSIDNEYPLCRAIYELPCLLGEGNHPASFLWLGAWPSWLDAAATALWPKALRPTPQDLDFWSSPPRPQALTSNQK